MDLTNFIQLDYCITTVVAVFVFLKWGVKFTATWQKRFITVVVGLTLGVLWYFLSDATISKLITSFFVSVGFYSTILKSIMDSAKFRYDK